MKKNILLISIHGDPLESLGSTQAGGQNNYVKQLMTALSKKDYQVDVLTHWSNPDDSPVERINDRLRVIRISADKLKYIPKDKMFDILSDFYQEVKSRIDLKKYDILHTNYWLSGILGYVIKEDFHLPWTHTSHSLGLVKAKETGEVDQLRINAENVIFRHVNCIIATTNNEKQVILDNYKVRADIKVIGIGVDPIFFLPKRPMESEKPYFIYTGRLEETKGIQTLLSAFRKVSETNDHVSLMIVGGGCKESGTFEIPAEIKQSIQGIKDKVIFKGGLPQEKLVDLYAHAIAAVVPSYYESFGMVAAEAQATGVPVIATKVGGLQEIVKDEVTGYLFAKKDAKHLTTLMLKLLESQEVRTKLGNQARKHARAKFDWQQITDEIIALYKELEDHEEEISISN